MQASRMFTLLVGLVGPLLSGCATTRPDVESQLAAEVARLNASTAASGPSSGRRFRRRTSSSRRSSHGWMRSMCRCRRGSGTAAAVQVVPAPEPPRAMEQALEQLRQRSKPSNSGWLPWRPVATSPAPRAPYRRPRP